MNLFKLASSYRCVSFDVFDTLLYRKVDLPTQVFEIVEGKLVRQYGDVFCGFAKKRIDAANKAYKNGKKETTLDDIYELIPLSNQHKKAALDEEIKTEIECVRPNGILKELVKRLKGQGVKIVIISDMYLPEFCLSKMLQSNEICYDYLYVSSETQARKSTGEMFDYVLNDLKISRKDLFHIGDNKRSDYLIPKLKGIKAFRWNENPKKHINILRSRSGATAGVIYDLVNTDDSLDYYQQIGYKMYGPALLGFCQWIHQTVIDEKLDSICFLARDGQIVKKAYELLYPDDYMYFLASRRTLTVPLLKDADSMEFILQTIPYIKRQESIQDLLSKVGISDKKFVDQIINDFGEIIDRSELYEQFGSKLYDAICDKLHENAASEYKSAIGYIESNLPKGKIGLVDIGWYGTMQQSMAKLCLLDGKEDYSFVGLYFGLLSKADGRNKDIAAHGFIYDFNREEVYSNKLIYGFNGLIELMFTADHGSAKRYYETTTGGFECELEENHGEYSDFVRKVQKGALHFLEVYSKRNINIKVDANVAFASLEDLLVHASVTECAALGDLMFYDAYFEKIIQFDGWKALLKKPKQGMTKFLKSNWKLGYLKEMLPFITPSKVYVLLNKIKK